MRAVGDAAVRFREDKLRMLRGVRMASTFGFALDPATFEAIRNSAAEIGAVSPERIAQEIRAMFGRSGQAEAARLLMAAGLAAQVLPEVLPLCERKSSFATGSAWDAAVAMLAEFEKAGIRKPPLALAALLQETSADDSHGAVHAATAVLRRWRMSNEEREHVEWLVEHRRSIDGAASRRWSEVQPVLAHRWGPDLVEFVAARHAVADDDDDRERRVADLAFARKKLAEPRAMLDPPPLLTGNDLVRRGLRPGKQFAVLLEKVRAAQLDGMIATADEAATLVAELLKAGP